MEKKKYTPLYKYHVNLGAKMVLFAGYQMPINYLNGIISEHLKTRSNAGLFDVSHMLQIDMPANIQITNNSSTIPTNQQSHILFISG